MDEMQPGNGSVCLLRWAFRYIYCNVQHGTISLRNFLHDFVAFLGTAARARNSSGGHSPLVPPSLAAIEAPRPLWDFSSANGWSLWLATRYINAAGRCRCTAAPHSCSCCVMMHCPFYDSSSSGTRHGGMLMTVELCCCYDGGVSKKCSICRCCCGR